MNGIGNRRGRMAALIAAGATLFAAACSQAPPKKAAKSSSAIPVDYQTAAESMLGDNAEVILSGDFARNNHIQLLIVNRLPKMPKNNIVPGLLVSRAAILEKDSGDWREIFLADEHLKNPKGFLAGTPLASVSSWRLQYEQQTGGLVMYFTPVQQSADERPTTIEVRWNSAVHRYQALDRDFKHFLSEAPSLGPKPEFQMKR